MGTTRWSDAHYFDRAKVRARTGKDVFEHDRAIQDGEVEAAVHPKMNPRGVRCRESRDSDTHPESLAIGVLFDVTGSMQKVPRILQKKLPSLMGSLLRKGYVEHPQILIGAIGDATCDRAPLQVGQFESGIEIEEDLGKLFLKGGGGQVMESASWRCTSWPATPPSIASKAGARLPLHHRARCPIHGSSGRGSAVTSAIRPEDIPVDQVIAELQQTYHLYYAAQADDVLESCHRSAPMGGLAGRELPAPGGPAGICELIASRSASPRARWIRQPR